MELDFPEMSWSLTPDMSGRGRLRCCCEVFCSNRRTAVLSFCCFDRLQPQLLGLITKQSLQESADSGTHLFEYTH